MSEIYKKFGQVLKLERENRNVSLADFADELKISEENLYQIENGDIDGLPSELYYNLFAKSYAKALGIDFNKTLDAIKEDLGEPIEPEDIEKTDKKEPSRKSVEKSTKKPDDEAVSESVAATVWFKKKFITLIIAIVAIFIIFMAVYKIFLEEESPEYQTDPAPEVSNNAMPVDEPMTSETDAALADFQWSVPPKEAPVNFTMLLTSREECWVSLIADGDTAIFRNLVPWREYRVEAKYRMKITVAQPSQVEIKLNDKPVDLRNRETRRISNLEINQVNLDSFLNPPPEEEIEQSTPAISRPAAQPRVSPSPTQTPETAIDSTEVETNKPTETQVENEQI